MNELIASPLGQRIAELDYQLCELAKPILVLKYLSWPDTIEDAFIQSWRAGRAVLPDIRPCVPNWRSEIEALDDFVIRCEGEDPLLQFLRRSAWSYAEAARMLMSAGTSEFTTRSINLYGRPDDIYATQSFTGVDAAAFLLEKTDALLRGSYVAPSEAVEPAEQFAKRF
jgi:hypothetical protein